MTESEINPPKPLQPEDFDLYRRMVENSRDGICITQNGMFRYANQAFCDMLGYTLEELTSVTGPDLLAEKDKERIVAQHYKRMEGEQGKSIDYITMIRKDGTLIDIEMSANAIQLEGYWASFISARDITERNKMQEALEKSEQKYRMLIENAQDGIIITQDGQFKLVNKAFCEIIEYAEEELMNMSFLDVVSNEDRDRLLEYHKLRMSGSRHHMIYEAKGISKSGKIVDFEINTTFIEYNDRPATFIILRDQTERKSLEVTVRNSERKYRKLFEAESDAIFLIEKETGRILDANPAASHIYGYSHEEFLRLKNIDVSAEPESTQSATSHDAGYVPVRYHKKKDGSVFAVEITAGITDLDNNVVHIVTVRDITERIRIQETLKASERKYRELSDFLPQTIFELDTEGRLVYLNKAGMETYGFTQSPVGVPAIEGVIPEDQERMLDNIRKAFSDNRTMIADEYTARRIDDTTFPVMI